MHSPPLLLAERIRCARAIASDEPSALRDLSAGFDSGTLTVIHGPPGCGKNLLLRVLGLLEVPDAGEVRFRGEPTRCRPEPERAALRNRHFGFLFREPFLLPSFSVIENIAMPLLKLTGAGLDEARERTNALLDFAGLHDLAKRPVADLSLFEQHLVSLARAMVNEPAVLLIEDMDRDLAPEEVIHFLGLLQRAASEFQSGVILSADEPRLAQFASRDIRLIKGRIESDSGAPVAPRRSP